jgi:LmbE family N-acetylglucosaminyl deacetylase
MLSLSLCLCVSVVNCLSVLPARGEPSAGESASGVAIQQALRRFREMGSVLYVAAHPDDENTQLITYLARGRGYRTAYLSLTRGDGGQNVLGGEFGAQLGVIRTQELLAARRLDGGRQFFTRALDFGFSKSAAETLQVWDHQQVLADVVRVIRTFRPDVMVTRFSPTAGGTHGHHTASAVLAVEAFKLAGDPQAFPEQLGDLKPWQPKRILQNGGGPLQIDISGDDPVLGEPFAAIAGRSRSMHKSQGFGNFGGRGGGPRRESFSLLGGDPATSDLMDGVDTTWNRVPGGAEIGAMAEVVIAAFNPSDPSASVPAVLKLRARLAALPHEPLVAEKRRDLDHILQQCLGLTVATTIPTAQVVPGESLRLHHAAMVRAAVPVRWVAVRYPTIRARRAVGIDLRPGEMAARDVTEKLPAGTPASQPYWLREEPTAGMFRVDDPKLIGRPENPPAFPVEQEFAVGGQTLLIAEEPVQAATAGGQPERLEVIPPVSLQPARSVRLFAPGASKAIEVEVTAARAGSAGTLRLEAPAGWNVSPASQSFRTAGAGDRTKLSFTVTAPPGPATGEILARATVNGVPCDTERIEIRYPHIPPLLLQPRARVKVVALDMAIRGREVGYLPGAGDAVAPALEEMGYHVTPLTGADLTADRLRGFDTVVIGVRAFNVRTDLADHMPALFAYVESGGNVIEQYNRPESLKTNKLAPYDLSLSTLRVTDEHAPVTLLAPDHPVLNTPNKITPADFDGWVQERGIYYPEQWDEHFTPILASGDPGEEPLKGGLLVARYGKGYFVYTGLVWFRQLPAGAPGAYRLFANLVSLGR